MVMVVPHPNTRSVHKSENSTKLRARCAQVFYGLASHHMESKNQFPDVYKEFIRDQGLPTGLHRDNAAELKSRKISQLNLDYSVKESFAEAGNPNQNHVEVQAIKWIKGWRASAKPYRSTRFRFDMGLPIPCIGKQLDSRPNFALEVQSHQKTLVLTSAALLVE
jgi:hypothetical protein